MKKVIVFLFALFTGSVMYAQKVSPSANIITEHRTMLNFSQLSVSNGIDMVITFAENEGIEIQAPDNIVQFIETIVLKDVLYVRFQKGFKLYGSAAVKVNVNMKTLTKLTATKRSRVALENALAVDKLDIELSESELTGHITVQKASLTLEKTSQANLTGTCRDLKLILSGSSTIGNTSFAADAVTAKLSKQSTARLKVNESIEFNGTKESNFYYLGNPKIKGIKASGNSGIYKAD